MFNYKKFLGAAALTAGVLAASSALSQQTLVVAAQKTPNGLDHDYHFSAEDHQIRAALYDKLLALGQTEGADGLSIPSYAASDITGRLAESWSLSEDGKTLTIKLREGVMSHAGNELTAEDVQWTWDRSWALDAVGAFYAKFILNLKEPSWRIVDTYTWELTTPDVNAMTTLLMVNNDLDVIDATEAKKHTTEDDPWATEWMATNAAGFGAYRLSEWTPGDRVVLEAFDDYYRGEADIDRVIYREVPEAANRFALVTSGSVDIAENLAPRFLLQASEMDGVKLWQTRGNRVFRLEVNHEDGLGADPRVLKALNHATPTEQILEAVFFGFAEPSKGPVPSSYPMARPDYWTYDYDPDTARKLLDEAGATGEELVIHFDSNSVVQKNTAVLLKTSYEAVGLEVRLVEMSSAVYTSELYKGAFPAFFMLEFPILPDPGYALALNYPCGSFLNASNYCNPKVDALLEEASQTLDVTKREELYSETQRLMIAEDANSVWLAEPGWQLVTKQNVSGVGWGTPNIYQFYDLSIE